MDTWDAIKTRRNVRRFDDRSSSWAQRPPPPRSGRGHLAHLGQAVENAMLAAWELGIGSCHASVYDEPRVREILGYPPEMTCDLVVSFGYPEDPGSLAPPGSQGGRKLLPDLRHEERFGG